MTIINAFLVVAATTLWVTQSLAGNLPVVDPSTIIAKYGKPDHVTSTEFDRPRPPLVTKMLEYRKENVRFILLANAPAGTPPPYKSWLFAGTQDIKNYKSLSADEVSQRMRLRIQN